MHIHIFIVIFYFYQASFKSLKKLLLSFPMTPRQKQQRQVKLNASMCKKLMLNKHTSLKVEVKMEKQTLPSIRFYTKLVKTL